MVAPLIEVEALSKTYRVPVKGEGLSGSLRSLWNREYRDVEAVKIISFRIAAGERVGVLGPNGAGNTTTLKMLSGLLFPTSGQIRIAGFTPQDRAVAFLGRITLVMGQKQHGAGHTLVQVGGVRCFAARKGLRKTVALQCLCLRGGDVDGVVANNTAGGGGQDGPGVEDHKEVKLVAQVADEIAFAKDVVQVKDVVDADGFFDLAPKDPDQPV